MNLLVSGNIQFLKAAGKVMFLSNIHPHWTSPNINPAQGNRKNGSEVALEHTKMHSI